jgi:pilus assembly protein Flp/PilA
LHPFRWTASTRILAVSIQQENKMRTFLTDETGLELSEYAVAAALVAIAVVAAFSALGDAIGVKLNWLVDRVNGS